MVLIRYLCGINQIKTVMEKLFTQRYRYVGPDMSVYASGDREKDLPPHQLFAGMEVEAEVNINIATVTAYFTDDGREEITVGIDPVDVAAKYLVPIKREPISFKDNIDKVLSELPQGAIDELRLRKDNIEVGGQHYQTAIQPWDFIHANGLDFDSGNIVKYASRHKKKGGAEDVKKIISYAKHILKTQYGIDYGKTD